MATNPYGVDKSYAPKTGQLEIDEKDPREDETPQSTPPGGIIPRPPKLTGGGGEGGGGDTPDAGSSSEDNEPLTDQERECLKVLHECFDRILETFERTPMRALLEIFPDRKSRHLRFGKGSFFEAIVLARSKIGECLQHGITASHTTYPISPTIGVEAIKKALENLPRGKVPFGEMLEKYLKEEVQTSGQPMFLLIRKLKAFKAMPQSDLLHELIRQADRCVETGDTRTLAQILKMLKTLGEK